jgi:hypothetical protein
MYGTMSTCITGVSSAINIRVVKTTLKVSETPQRAWNPNNPTCNAL